MKISAQIKKGDFAPRKGEVDLRFGKSLDAAIERYGAELVLHWAQSAFVIAAQSALRSALTDDKYRKDGFLQEEMNAWKPKVQRRMTPAERFDAAFAKLTPERRKAFMVAEVDRQNREAMDKQ